MSVKNFLFSKSACSVEVLLRKRSYSGKNNYCEKVTNLKKGKKAAVLKKLLSRKSNYCVKVVTLKKCEEVASPKIKLS